MSMGLFEANNLFHLAKKQFNLHYIVIFVEFLKRQ